MTSDREWLAKIEECLVVKVRVSSLPKYIPIGKVLGTADGVEYTWEVYRNDCGSGIEAKCGKCGEKLCLPWDYLFYSSSITKIDDALYLHSITECRIVEPRFKKPEKQAERIRKIHFKRRK